MSEQSCDDRGATTACEQSQFLLSRLGAAFAVIDEAGNVHHRSPRYDEFAHVGDPSDGTVVPLRNGFRLHIVGPDVLAGIERDELAYLALEELPSAVYVKDRALRYRYVNAAFEDLFARGRLDLLGKADRQLFADGVGPHWDDTDLELLQRGGIVESEQKLTDGQGQMRTALVRACRIRKSNGDPFILAMICDVTAEARMHETLLARYHDLKQVVTRLEGVHGGPGL